MRNFTFLFLLGIFTFSVNAQNKLPLIGMDANHEGVIGWNNRSGAFGHLIPKPYNAFGNDTAYYYLRSRSKGFFDEQGKGGMHGTSNFTGFTNLAAKLAFYGKTIADLSIDFSDMDLNSDTRGTEWDLINDTENRTYIGGTFVIKLNKDTLAIGNTPALKMLIDYNSEQTPFDDVITGKTGYTHIQTYINPNYSEATKTISKALFQDVNQLGVRLVFNSIQPAGQTEFDNGTFFAGFFNVADAQFETSSINLPNLPDTIYLCKGDSLILDAGKGFSNPKWSNRAVGQSITVKEIGEYYFQGDYQGETYTSKVVKVLAKPTANATITPQGNTSFCQGGFVNLNASTGANYTYQWLNNSTPFFTATTATYKVTTSGKYSVIVKNNSGCIDTSSVVTVTVTPTPSLPILTGPATLCYNSKAIFKASIAGGTWGVANDYLLISSPQGLFRNNKMPPSNLYKTGVTYTLKSKDQLCSVTAQKSVWIRNVAATSVTLTASKQTLKVGEEVAATATTKITGNALFWMSASSSFVSVAGTSSPYIAIVKGLKPVTGANITFSINDLTKGCRNAAFLPFSITAAASLVENETNNTTFTSDLNVYPNPSNGIVTLENIGEAKTISLIDVTGRVLKTTPVNADRMRLDYSNITKGNYFISIQGETIKEMKSIVIE